jgi:hypothetical protein
MQKINQYNKSNDISDKGQKIVAALYLVTDHLSDNEPIKISIRSTALGLFGVQADRSTTVTTLTNLLKSSTIAKIINEHNTSILVRELGLFAQSSSETGSLAPLFASTDMYQSRTKIVSYKSPVSDISNTQIRQTEVKQENKNKRQDQILSFINGRKSAVIKDISTLFPDVSEKTIQRELGTLVDSGKITKRGSKRWSIYMAI